MIVYVTFDENIPSGQGLVIQISNQNGLIYRYTLDKESSIYNLIVSGDDPTTNEIDGFRINEVFQAEVVSPAGNQLFRIRYLDRDEKIIERPRFQPHETLILKIEKIGANEILPDQITLFDNYPNPFNPETKIKFYLPNREWVQLDIFNINGQLVKTLYSGILPEGMHSFKWNGTSNRDIAVSSGVYLYVLRYSHGSLTKKMILMR